MELDIQENMIREREGKEAQLETKEAQASKDPSTTTCSATNKGKTPMEDISQESITQHAKALIHTSEQINPKLTRMTSQLDTQEIETSQPNEAAYVTTVVDKTQHEKNQVEMKPLK